MRGLSPWWAGVLLAAQVGCTEVSGDERSALIQDRPVQGAKAASGSSSPAVLVGELRDEIAQTDIEAVPAAPDFDDELVELGRMLAFDPELSGNRDISCMTCHYPTLGTDDDRVLPIGTGGIGLGVDRTHPEEVRVPRHATPLLNLHTLDSMFWDGRVSVADDGSYETPAGDQLTEDMAEVFDEGAGLAGVQAMFPVTSREEMRGHEGDNELADIEDGDLTEIWEALMVRLLAIEEYEELFASAYPDTEAADLSFAHAANAIGAFEITSFEASTSPWDEFLRGDDDALATVEIVGALEFFDAGCAACHSGSGLQGTGFANTGLAQFGPGKGHGSSGFDDLGRQGVTNDEADRYGFRIPMLANIALTAPYGHVGQYESLTEMVGHYEDPVGTLEDYDIEDHVEDGVLYDQIEDNVEEVCDSLDPRIDTDARLNERLIVKFFDALTDPAATDFSESVPESVPSGLPLDSDEVD